MGKDSYTQHEAARFNLLRGIWAGRGIHGQKVLEFIISGYADSEQAKGALGRQLEKLIKVENKKLKAESGKQKAESRKLKAEIYGLLTTDC
jgi:hypothetical protein